MPILTPVSTVTEWRTLFADVAPNAPQCPTFEMEDYLRKAAREFFRVSCCWRSRTVELLTTVADQAEYTFNVPSDSELNRVHSAYDDSGDEVDVMIPGQEDDTDPTESDSVFTIGVVDGGAGFRLAPLPSTAGVVLTGTVSYIPSINAAGIPTWAYNEWRHEIASGAVALLVIQPNKAWSNPNAYALHQGMFDRGIREASHGAGPIRRKPLRVTPC